jgi:hypothetical protein
MTANDYCSAAEIKALMPDVASSTSYDTILATLATRASRAIDRFTKRLPGAYNVTTAADAYFDGNGGIQLWVGEMAAAPTTVGVAESGAVDSAAGSGGTYTTWAVTDYQLWPANALLEGQPYLRLDIDVLNGSKSYWYRYPKAVKITTKWGFAAATPDDVKMYACIQAMRYFKRGQQAFRDVGAIAELGQLQYVKELDPDISVGLAHLVRTVV